MNDKNSTGPRRMMPKSPKTPKSAVARRRQLILKTNMFNDIIQIILRQKTGQAESASIRRLALRAFLVVEGHDFRRAVFISDGKEHHSDERTNDADRQQRKKPFEKNLKQKMKRHDLFKYIDAGILLLPLRG